MECVPHPIEVDAHVHARTDEQKDRGSNQRHINPPRLAFMDKDMETDRERNDEDAYVHAYQFSCEYGND